MLTNLIPRPGLMNTEVNEEEMEIELNEAEPLFLRGQTKGT